MSTLILLVGPPGSGKTQLCSTRYSSYFRVSQDDMGKTGHYAEFVKAINRQDDIVVDRMNFSILQRKNYIDLAKSKNYEVKVDILYVPKQICLDRCISRKGHPTIKDSKGASRALETFFKGFEYPTLEEGINSIDEHRYSFPLKLETYICDLDGTLADITNRRHFLSLPKKDWKSFFENISNDTLNQSVYKTVSILRKHHEIVYVSGRPDKYFDQTEKWIKEVANFASPVIFMRPRNDFRRDDLIKEIILDFELLPRYDIIGVFDDRQQVVDMFRRRGLTVYQVDKGDF